MGGAGDSGGSGYASTCNHLSTCVPACSTTEQGAPCSGNVTRPVHYWLLYSCSSCGCTGVGWSGPDLGILVFTGSWDVLDCGCILRMYVTRLFQ